MDLDGILRKLRAEFQSPEIGIEDFQNWGKTQKAKVFVTRPGSTEEVQKVIKAAKKHNLKVRAVGSTHSWSPLYPDDGNILINGTSLQTLPKDFYPGDYGKKVTHNSDAMTVTIASGVNMQELMDFFLENNICFPSNVILRDVTIAGIVSTGCHGVGNDQLCVSDWITAVTLVDSDGEHRKFSLDTDGSEVMQAMQVSLGMCGILTSVTMKVQKQFLVRTDNLFPRVLDYFFDPASLMDFVNKNWSVEMFWFPFNGMEVKHFDLLRASIKGHVSNYSWNPMLDQIWVRAINPYKDGELHLPPVGKKYHQHDRFDDTLANDMLKYAGKFEHFLDHLPFHMGKTIDGFIHRHFDPLTLYMSFKIIKDQYGPSLGICQQVTDAIHYRTYKNLVAVYDMSFAFNCPNTEDGFHNACLAITKVIELVQKYAIEGQYPLTTTMEMRWISHSDTLLAPAIVGKPKGYTLYLEILSFEDTDKALTFFNDVAKEWKKIKCEGIMPLPHWGKMWGFIPGINEYLREGYGKNIEKFKAVRDSLKVDKNNMFTNGRLIDVFSLH